MPALFRIHRALPRAQRSTLPSTRTPDGYGARLLKLIPAEVIALYLAGRGIITADAEPILGVSAETVLLSWGLIGLVLVVALRWWGTADRSAGEKVQLSTVVVSVISYLVWIYSLGDSFAEYGVHDPKLAGLLVIAWTFAVPFLVRGTRDEVTLLPAG